MGLFNFLKDKKNDSSSDESAKGRNVPLPPQKPSKGSPAPPSSNSQDSSTSPAPPPSGNMPDVPSAPSQPSMPQAPKAQGKSGGMPQAPAAQGKGKEPEPEAPKQQEPAPQAQAPQSQMGDMDVPAAPPKQKDDMGGMSVPKAPADKPAANIDTPRAPAQSSEFALPEFDESELQEIEEREQQSKIDWTQSPEGLQEPEPLYEEPEEDFTVAPEEQAEQEPQKQEDGIDFTKPLEAEVDSGSEELETEAPEEPVEEPEFEPPEEPAEPEPVEEPEEEQPELLKGSFYSDGDLFVKAENYHDLFDSINQMKEGVGRIQASVHNFSGLSHQQESHYDRIADILNQAQEKIMEIDTKVFEKR